MDVNDVQRDIKTKHPPYESSSLRETRFSWCQATRELSFPHQTGMTAHVRRRRRILGIPSLQVNHEIRILLTFTRDCASVLYLWNKRLAKVTRAVLFRICTNMTMRISSSNMSKEQLALTHSLLKDLPSNSEISEEPSKGQTGNWTTWDIASFWSCCKL